MPFPSVTPELAQRGGCELLPSLNPVLLRPDSQNAAILVEDASQLAKHSRHGLERHLDGLDLGRVLKVMRKLMLVGDTVSGGTGMPPTAVPVPV